MSNSVKVVKVIISSNQNIVSIHTSTSKYFIDSNNKEIKDDEPLRNNNFESLLIYINKQEILILIKLKSSKLKS